MKTSELYKIIKDNEDKLSKYPLVRMYLLVYENILADRGAARSISALSKILSDLHRDMPIELGKLIGPEGAITPKGLDVSLDNPLPPPLYPHWSGVEPDLTPIEPPPVSEQVKTLVDSVLKYAQSGFQNCTEEQYQERLAICKGCEFYDSEGFVGMGRCLKCGCSGAKLKLAVSSCPVNKWGSTV